MLQRTGRPDEVEIEQVAGNVVHVHGTKRHETIKFRLFTNPSRIQFRQAIGMLGGFHPSSLLRLRRSLIRRDDMTSIARKSDAAFLSDA